MSGWSAKTGLLVKKELRVEWRARDTLPPMIVFAMAVVLLLALSAPGAVVTRLARPPALGTLGAAEVASAFLWVTILFAGLIGFARGFASESAAGTLEILLMAPLDRSAIYVSKAAANLMFIVLVEILLVPLVTLLFSIDLAGSWPALLVVALLLDLGFVATGTLMAAVASTTRNRELMLPILALPMLVPAFLAALELTAGAVTGEGLATVAARGWFVILVAYDVAVSAVGIMTFDLAVD